MISDRPSQVSKFLLQPRKQIPHPIHISRSNDGISASGGNRLVIGGFKRLNSLLEMVLSGQRPKAMFFAGFLKLAMYW
jgi:hypothetical protein